MRTIHIIGGGTVAHVRPHLTLGAAAYGKVVDDLFEILREVPEIGDYRIHLYTTKMAGNRHEVWTHPVGNEPPTLEVDKPSNLETNADVAALLDRIVSDPAASIVFLPAALCDFMVTDIEVDGDVSQTTGKIGARLSSRKTYKLHLEPAPKIIQRVRKTRKDIFLVGFKTTTNAEKQDQFSAGLELMKRASCNLVLANDLATRLNMVITPEQAPYYVSTDRNEVLRGLVRMTLQRAQGHFTRSEVAEGTPVDWTGEGIPTALRTVVDHCIKRGAYKPFLGKTVGHFAFKAGEGAFVTSRRGVDFNQLDKVGMVTVQTAGDAKVIATGAKPSVGGQSQRIIFAEHPDLDCIVHFHCPLRPEAQKTRVQEKFGIGAETISVRSQEPYECGSHECGQNTSDGLRAILVNAEGTPMLKAVMLDKHGPNIVFNRRVDPRKVIDFIERHWDLERSTSEVP